jgi:small nuclear ribonucleoprotein (snRNP)-like protein
MTPEDLKNLKASVDKRVVLHCTDGEVITAEIVSVSDEHEDVIYDIVSSNRPEVYQAMEGKPAFVIPFADISFVEVVEK